MHVIKYLLSIFLIGATLSLSAQKIVRLIHSRSSTGVRLNGKDLIKVYQGTFKQDYSTLTSDSAYFYPQDNAFDAFGNVNINQGDTLNIYSDKLNYNGNTKIAILTDHVRMVDKDATLTTDHLTYNTATRIGTYTEGGKLVNKDNVLVSKNGYYFAFTRDSYFRYDVVLTSPDVLIKTDTMRYNTGTKIAYFYGPTDIYSTKGKKGERDTLYTENGFYNTVVEQAAFGKNNLYKSGTKSLKGDSLFYDKIRGYGRAVKHVTFLDREQKITIKGQLGNYYKTEERAVVTEDPYVILVTEKKDSTASDSGKKIVPVINKVPANGKQPMNLKQVVKNTVPVKIDTVDFTGKENQAGANSLLKQAAKNNPVQKVADSLKKQKTRIPLNNLTGAAGAALNAQTISGKQTGLKKPPGKPVDLKVPVKPPALKDTSKVKTDSIYISADTIETQIYTYKDLKAYQEKQRLAHVRDTTSKSKVPVKAVSKDKPSKFLTAMLLKFTPDTIRTYPNYFGPPPARPKKPVKPPSKKQLEQDSLAKKAEADSIKQARLLEPGDTARIRILIAHHHFKMFKSDLQAKSDSMFYSNSDSTIRCYVNPMLWSEGSQLSGDTIYLQMKHKKLDNMRMFPNAFIVNIDKTDSTHFNQIGGKRMRGYFRDDKLYRIFIEGNAESIYFSRDSAKNTITGMERSLSSRIKVDFVDNKVTNLALYTKPQDTYGPLGKFTEDDKVLKGFIWKPKDRPFSKESIIPSYNRKASAGKTKAAKAPAGKGKAAKAPLKKLPDAKAGNDSTLKPALPAPGSPKALKDSTSRRDTLKTPAVKVNPDSVKNRL